MQLDLSGRHALVCGASEGIARACAISWAKALSNELAAVDGGRTAR